MEDKQITENANQILARGEDMVAVGERMKIRFLPARPHLEIRSDAPGCDHGHTLYLYPEDQDILINLLTKLKKARPNG